MRVGLPSLALACFVFWPFACAVYNDETLGLGLGGSAPIDNSAGGTSAGASGKGGDLNTGKTGGTSAAQAGSAPTGGTAAETLAGTGGGGNMPASGGDGSADGGEMSGGAASGGKGGAGGSSGSGAGSGGKGGAGGGAGGAPPTAGASGNGGSAGNSGTGGGPSIPLCKDHPLTARASWTATASHPTSGDLPPNLLDGKITRWSTGKAQSGDEWLQIDFGAQVSINHVNLQQGDDTNDYPRTYSVIVSNTAKDLSGTVRGTGSGKTGVSTAILLPALATGRYLLIKQTATSLSWWSAEEIEVSCAD